MKTYAVIKDSVRNTPLVIAVREEGMVSVHGINEYGKSVTQHILKTGSIDSKSMPDGVEITEFKSITGNTAALFETYISKSIMDIPNIESTIVPAIKTEFDRKTRGKAFKERSILSEGKESSQHSGKQIRKFSNVTAKINMVAFKAGSFKSRLKKSSVITSLSAYGIGFDSSINQIVQKDSKRITNHSIDKINDYVGEGQMRRFARKSMVSNLDGTRLTRRSSALSKKIEEISEKSVRPEHRYSESIKSRLKRLS
jgi:hypothetical protein